MSTPDIPPNHDIFLAWLNQKPRHCPNCRYTLQGLRDARCPECGVSIVLRIAPAESRTRVYFVGLVGIAVGLGFFSLLGLLAVAVAIFGRSPPRIAKLFFASALGAIVFGALINLWSTRRRAFRALSPHARAVLASATWAAAVGAIAAFVHFVD